MAIYSMDGEAYTRIVSPATLLKSNDDIQIGDYIVVDGREACLVREKPVSPPGTYHGSLRTTSPKRITHYYWTI